MSNYRRSLVRGGTYFFTLVTENRIPILCDPTARRHLGDAIRTCKTRWPFDALAMVLLPDHLHTLWTLPDGDADYSRRWAFIKKELTKRWLGSGGAHLPVNYSRIMQGRRGVLQRRFWEHTIRDDRDLRMHLDYIHWNPVKHSHARCPHGWAYSSFHRFVQSGFLNPNWGCSCDGKLATKFSVSDISAGE